MGGGLVESGRGNPGIAAGEGRVLFLSLPSKQRSFILPAPTADWLSTSRRFNDRGVEPSRGEPKAKRQIVIETDRQTLAYSEGELGGEETERSEGGRKERKIKLKGYKIFRQYLNRPVFVSHTLHV